MATVTTETDSVELSLLGEEYGPLSVGSETGDVTRLVPWGSGLDPDLLTESAELRYRTGQRLRLRG